MQIEYEISVAVSLQWEESCKAVELHIHKVEGEKFLTIQVQPLLN